MDSNKKSISELLDALDDLEDGIQYIREIIQDMFFGGFVYRDEEEEDIDEDDDFTIEPEKEEKTE